jgi:hypothetical protein
MGVVAGRARLARIDIGGPPAKSQTFCSTSLTDVDAARGDFGLIGLAVMGQNLILNAADHGFTVVAFNRTVSKVDHFLANEAQGMHCTPSFARWGHTDQITRQVHCWCPLH